MANRARIRLSTARLIALVAVGPALFSLHALAQSAGPLVSAKPAAPDARAPASTPGVEPIRIEYRGPAGCSDSAGFLGNLLGRTSRARAATAYETARVFRVSVTERRGEHVGEISVQRPGEATLVRFSASGECENVVDSLAQFAAIVVDPSVASTPIRDGELPANPYRNWTGPLAEPLPENPYRNWEGDLAPALPENPYRSLIAAGPSPTNPHRQLPAAGDELPDNPYRQRRGTPGR